MNHSKAAVIITGASSGIGWSTARHLHLEGYPVLLGARRKEKLQALCSELQSHSSTVADFHELDVTKSSSVDRFMQWAIARTERLGCLVNNAGLALHKDTVSKLDFDDVTQMWKTNVEGVLRMSQAVLPLFESQGYGHIINIGSISGEEVYEGGSAYCASKFGVKAVTKTLRLETLGKNIRISSVDPGMVETEFSLVRFDQDQQKARAVYKGMTPLKGEDIANAVSYILSCPPHVNIDSIRITPIAQGDSAHLSRK